MEAFVVVQKLYQFDELDPKVRKRLIEKYQKYEWEEDRSAELNDLFSNDLQELGLPSEDIAFSLGYSQGDGVAFYGSVDLKKFLQVNKLVGRFVTMMPDGEPIFSVAIKKYPSQDEHHRGNMLVEVEPDQVDEDDEWKLEYAKEAVDDFQTFFKEFIDDVTSQLEKTGYAVIEDYSSEEYITDRLRDEGCVFDESGDTVSIPLNAWKLGPGGTWSPGLPFPEEPAHPRAVVVL